MNMHPTRFPELNAILQDLTQSVEVILGPQFVGAYLQGSLAGPDADEHGDVDFVVVTTQAPENAELEALQTMHARIFDGSVRWAKHLEGSYFPQNVLRQFNPNHAPLWYLDNGSRQLVQDRHDDTRVVRWVLRDHGITLKGPSPTALIDPIHPNDLRLEVFEVMHEWGQEILANPEARNNGWFQPYAVLSYCRMLHTLQTGRVASKRAGAVWGQTHLEPRWHGLIERALAQRPNQYDKVHRPADPEDFSRTLAFIRYALEARERFLGVE